MIWCNESSTKSLRVQRKKKHDYVRKGLTSSDNLWGIWAVGIDEWSLLFISPALIFLFFFYLYCYCCHYLSGKQGGIWRGHFLKDKTRTNRKREWRRERDCRVTCACVVIMLWRSRRVKLEVEPSETVFWADCCCLCYIKAL